MAGGCEMDNKGMVDSLVAQLEASTETLRVVLKALQQLDQENERLVSAVTEHRIGEVMSKDVIG